MAYMQSNDPFLTDVLHSLRSGEERALEQIFGLYKDKLYAFCYKTLKSKDLADDVVIEVFTKIWDKRSEVRTDTSFDAFVFTIARNLLLNFLKKLSLEAKLQDELKLSAEFYYSQEQKSDIYDVYLSLAEQVLRQMPTQRQKVFRLRLEKGLSYDEIASLMGVSRNTVKSHILEATRQLKANAVLRPDLTILLILLEVGVTYN
jgi:RNA polymerase sigma-70 factor (family 1)